MGRGQAHIRSSPPLTAALLSAAAAAAGVTLALALLAPGHHARAGPAGPITVSTSLSPREHFFGDRVAALVVVRVQPAVIDPRTVSVQASFAPYTTLGHPKLERTGGSIVLRARLSCLTAGCAPKAPQRALVLPPVRVRFRAGDRDQTALEPWPPLLVASRLTRNDLLHPALRARLQLPPQAHADRTLGWTLTGLAALLFLVAGLPMAVRLFRPAVTRAACQPRTERLVAALAEVERLADDNDAARRTAVDRLAGALAGNDLDEIAPHARSLAWSRQPPGSEAMRRLLESIQRLTRLAA